jgi:CDP-diacylglycerol--glycerol-3-phosphate 3-phosphatidyltransferase
LTNKKNSDIYNYCFRKSIIYLGVFLFKLSILQLRNNLKDFIEKLLNPVIALLNFLKITPNLLTVTGFFINLIASYCIYRRNFIAGAIIILIAGLFDMLDGTLARKMNMKTKFGGFLDSTVDRLSEGILYLGILFFYISTSNKNGIILSYSAMFFSFLISYTRARASGLKIDCETGIFTRPERIIVLILGLLIDQLMITLIIINILSIITVIQRVIKVYKDAKLLN